MVLPAPVPRVLTTRYFISLSLGLLDTFAMRLLGGRSGWAARDDRRGGREWERGTTGRDPSRSPRGAVAGWPSRRADAQSPEVIASGRPRQSLRTGPGDFRPGASAPAATPRG